MCKRPSINHADDISSIENETRAYNPGFTKFHQKHPNIFKHFTTFLISFYWYVSALIHSIQVSLTPIIVPTRARVILLPPVGTREERQRGTTGRLMGAVPQIPPPLSNPDRLKQVFASDARWKSTVYAYRSQITHCLDANRFFVLMGPPGCGKTTFLPQVSSVCQYYLRVVAASELHCAFPHSLSHCR